MVADPQSAEPAALPTLIDGQVYRWSWRDSLGDQQQLYWCKSRIAIVRNGRLFDTFWHSPSPEHEVDPAKVDLEFLCDQSWPQIKDYEVCYYDPGDVVDTRHPNSSIEPIYLRPGARKSKEAIRAELASRRETAESMIRRGQWRIEEIDNQQKLLDTGKIDEVRL